MKTKHALKMFSHGYSLINLNKYNQHHRHQDNIIFNLRKGKFQAHITPSILKSKYKKKFKEVISQISSLDYKDVTFADEDPNYGFDMMGLICDL